MCLLLLILDGYGNQIEKTESDGHFVQRHTTFELLGLVSSLLVQLLPQQAHDQMLPLSATVIIKNEQYAIAFQTIR